MILSVPLTQNPEVPRRLALAWGWEPTKGVTRSKTPDGETIVTKPPNPESDIDFLIRRIQEFAHNAYANTELEVVKEAISEEAKQKALEQGIVGYKEAIAIPK